tara:strand:+ start:12928 stop:13224 length:297 start_codon:yes stop_codon:yes gene_type:complete
MNDIKFEEFFTLSKLLNSSEEDYNIGNTNIKNLNFKNLDLVYTLFAKSLSLEKRAKFIRDNNLSLEWRKLIGKDIYKSILKIGNNEIHKQILKKIMTN